MTFPSDTAQQDIEFLSHFSELPDPRQLSKVLYPLNEVLLLSLCAVLSGADSFVEIAAYGVKKRDFLRRFSPFANGTPSHDQLGNIFAALDPQAFQRCFIAWVSALQADLNGVVAIDGKTLRRSRSTAAGKDPVHMISAFAASRHLVLGQRQVDGKSNEITAIPELLDLLHIDGALVTIDAMGCHRAIADRILDRGGQYILALKGNQGALHSDVKLFFEEHKACDYADTAVTCHETMENNHDRLETRTVTVCDDIAWLAQRHNWPGLTAIVMVEYRAERRDKTHCETRFHIASQASRAPEMAKAIRQHWAIENGLHWVLDMVFRDDECRVRSANAPANFTTIKHMAANLLRTAKGKESMRLKRRLTAMGRRLPPSRRQGKMIFSRFPCDIRRIEETLERFGDRFTNRVFTEVERARSDRRKMQRAASFAKRFAAKEACSKALGTGLRRGVFWRDMGVTNLKSGKPTLQLTGGAAERLHQIVPIGHAPQIDLTLTDDLPWAQAIVIISAVPEAGPI